MILHSYEQEQLKRVKIIHVKGTDAATPEERERYIFKPTFKPLWQKDTPSQVKDAYGLLSSPVCMGHMEVTDSVRLVWLALLSRSYTTEG